MLSSFSDEKRRLKQEKYPLIGPEFFFLKSNIFFKAFFEFVTILVLFYVLVCWP